MIQHGVHGLSELAVHVLWLKHIVRDVLCAVECHAATRIRADKKRRSRLSTKLKRVASRIDW